MEFEFVKKNVEAQTCVKKVPHLRVSLPSEEDEETGIEL